MAKKVKFLHILWALFLHPILMVGQNRQVVDSLKIQITNTVNDKEKINLYILTAQEFSHQNTDSAMYYLNQAQKIASKIGYKPGLAETSFLQSYYHDVTGNTSKAINSLENAVRYFIEIGDSSYLAACYNNLGAFYSYGKKQKESLQYFIKAAQIGEELIDSFALAEAYSNIGTFYEEVKEYRSALTFFQKALDIDLKYNTRENIAISYLDVGYINIKLRRYDDALSYLEKAHALIPEIEDPYFQSILHLRFATYYNETNELNRAKESIIKAKTISSSYDYPMLKADILAVQGEILLKEKKFQSGLSAIDSAINQYTSLDSPNLLYDLYKHKAEAYYGLNRHNQAYRFLQMSNEHEQSPEMNEISEILSNYEKEVALKTERNRLKLEHDLKIQIDENALIKVRSKLYFTIYLSILLGAILIIGLYFYALKRNHNQLLESNYELINHQKDLIETSYSDLKSNEKRLAELNATKDKFFSIIAHDLKNPFNTLIGLSELMINNPDIKESEDFEELMMGMFETARSGHNLLENLLEWSRSQIGTLKQEPQPLLLDEIFQSTKVFFQETARAKDISIYLPTETDRTVYADYNMVTFIVRNLVNNAIKFSQPGGQIHLLTSTENKSIVTCVKDYGIGMDKETIAQLFKIEHSVQRNGTNNEKGTGLGLILCKEFIEQSKGKIWVESTTKKGSCFYFSLPAC